MIPHRGFLRKAHRRSPASSLPGCQASRSKQHPPMTRTGRFTCRCQARRSDICCGRTRGMAAQRTCLPLVGRLRLGRRSATAWSRPPAWAHRPESGRSTPSMSAWQPSPWCRCGLGGGRFTIDRLSSFRVRGGRLSSGGLRCRDVWCRGRGGWNRFGFSRFGARHIAGEASSPDFCGSPTPLGRCPPSSLPPPARPRWSPRLPRPASRRRDSAVATVDVGLKMPEKRFANAWAITF